MFVFIVKTIKVIIGVIVIILALLNALPIPCCNDCSFCLRSVISEGCIIYSLSRGIIIYLSAIYLLSLRKREAFIYTSILASLVVIIVTLNQQTLIPDYI